MVVFMGPGVVQEGFLEEVIFELRLEWINKGKGVVLANGTASR